MQIMYIKGNAMLQLINTFTILLNSLSPLLMKQTAVTEQSGVTCWPFKGFPANLMPLWMLQLLIPPFTENPTSTQGLGVCRKTIHYCISLLCITVTKYPRLDNVQRKKVCLGHSFGCQKPKGKQPYLASREVSLSYVTSGKEAEREAPCWRGEVG